MGAFTSFVERTRRAITAALADDSDPAFAARMRVYMARLDAIEKAEQEREAAVVALREYQIAQRLFNNDAERNAGVYQSLERSLQIAESRLGIEGPAQPSIHRVGHELDAFFPSGRL